MEKFCTRFEHVMTLKTYDSTQHDSLSSELEALSNTSEQSLKPQIKELQLSYRDYVNDLKTKSDSSTNRKLCEFDYRRMKRALNKHEKKGKAGTHATVENLEMKLKEEVERSNQLSSELQQCRKELSSFKEELSKCEEEIKKNAVELDDLYKKYAQENFEKEHIKGVFKMYIDDRNELRGHLATAFSFISRSSDD